jgi:hypothetical protein
VAALGEQPCIERGPGLDVDPLQQLPPETGNHDGLEPGRRPECQDIHERVGPQLEHDRVAGERDARSDRAPQLGEVPAQGAQRVVGVGEQEAGRALARRRRRAEDEVREERPGLRPARSGDGSTVDLDPRCSDEVDPERQPCAPVEVRCARLGRRGSRRHIVAGPVGGSKRVSGAGMVGPGRRPGTRRSRRARSDAGPGPPAHIGLGVRAELARVQVAARRSASRGNARASEAWSRAGSCRRRGAETTGGVAAGKVVLIVVIVGSL